MFTELLFVYYIEPFIFDWCILDKECYIENVNSIINIINNLKD